MEGPQPPPPTLPDQLTLLLLTAVLGLIFVSANGFVKHSFCWEVHCIAKLLDTLLDWVSWCYSHKQTIRSLSVSQQQRKRMLIVANFSCCLCGMDVIIILSDSSVSPFANIFWRWPYKMQSEGQKDNFYQPSTTFHRNTMLTMF